MKRDKDFFLRYAASCTAAIFTATGIGCIITWSSPAVNYFKGPESELKMSEAEISWITPLLPIGSMIGYLSAPIVLNNFNQKWALLLFSVPQIASWILVITANNGLIVCVARVLGGMGYAGGLCSLTIYLSKISSSEETRGIFLSFVKLFQSIGIFFTLLLNFQFHYHYLNFIILFTLCFFVFVFLFMPDSSYFLKKVEKKEVEMVVLNGPSLWPSPGNKDLDIEDIEVVEKLLKNTTESQVGEEAVKGKEVVCERESIMTKEAKEAKEAKASKCYKAEQVITFQENMNFVGKKSTVSRIKSSNLWKLFAVAENRKAFIIVICCAAQEHFSGYAVIRAFTQQVFSYNKSFMSPEKSSLLLASVKLISSIICIQIIEKYPRKTLLLFTGFFATIGLILTASFFLLESCHVDVTIIGWVPLFGIALYDFNVTIGITNFIYIYLGELFVGDIKYVAITICKMIYLFFISFNISLFQIFEKMLGMHVIFGFYVVNSIVLGLIILKITPETKGKNFNEIQLLLKNKKS